MFRVLSYGKALGFQLQGSGSLGYPGSRVLSRVLV